MISRICAALIAVHFLTACAGSSTSTVEGSTAASSFATTPQSLTATDETGALTEIELQASGAFVAKLTVAHTYSMAVTTAAGDVPLLFPRANGQLDATFFINSADAVIQLGEIRAVNAMPTAGLEVSSQPLTETSTPAAATDDTEVTTCAPHHKHKMDGGCPGMTGASRRPGDRRPPNRDAGLGRPPRQGDPMQPFAYPQHAPPSTVDCGQ